MSQRYAFEGGCRTRSGYMHMNSSDYCRHHFAIRQFIAILWLSLTRPSHAMPKISTPPRDATSKPSAATLYRAEHQQDVLNRLRRIEGQVRGLSEMIQAGRDCEEVAQQMTATRRAMDKAFFRMMTCTVIEAATTAGNEEVVMLEIERKAKLLEKYG